MARARVMILLAKALDTAKTDMNLAQRQAELARRIALKYNIRFSYSDKQLYCKKCKCFILPGSTARIRIGYIPKAVKITCLECGHTYRKIIQSKDSLYKYVRENKPK